MAWARKGIREPSNGLLHRVQSESARADGRAGQLFSQLGFMSKGNCDREARPLAQLALYTYIAAVQPDQFVNERQADSSTFEAAPLTTLNSMKPLEEPR